MNKIEDFIHTGSRSNFYHGKYEPNLSRCRFSVAEYGRVTGWHQCNRKPVKEIEGYGFCTVHAREVERRLGVNRVLSEKFAASFRYGKPNLAKIFVANETDNTIDIDNYNTLMGKCFGLMTGNQKKNSTYTKEFIFVDDFNSAIAWLYEQSEQNVQSTFQAYEEAVRVKNKLEAEFLELEPKK